MEKVELHLHVAPFSNCAHVDCKSIATLYQRANYTAIVVTNHLSENVMSQYPLHGDAVDKMRYFCSAVAQLKLWCEPMGIRVFLGAEIALSCHFTAADLRHPTTEYLCYGLTEPFLMSHPNICTFTQRQLFSLCQSHRILMYQAHPFRQKSHLSDLDLMHGIELHNGNTRHDSHNVIAQTLCKEKKIFGISGSDFHNESDVSQGGIYVDKKIYKIEDLVDCLNDRSYTNIETL